MYLCADYKKKMCFLYYSDTLQVNVHKKKKALLCVRNTKTEAKHMLYAYILEDFLRLFEQKQ